MTARACRCSGSFAVPFVVVVVVHQMDLARQTLRRRRPFAAFVAATLRRRKRLRRNSFFFCVPNLLSSIFNGTREEKHGDSSDSTLVSSPRLYVLSCPTLTGAFEETPVVVVAQKARRLLLLLLFGVIVHYS